MKVLIINFLQVINPCGVCDRFGSIQRNSPTFRDYSKFSQSHYRIKALKYKNP